MYSSIKYFNPTKFALLVIGFIFIIFDVFAEEIDTLPHRSVVLDEVVIQSFKQSDNTNSLPVSASTVNKIDLQNQNVLDIKDISSFIPNLYMPDYGAKITSPVYIRGVGNKINDPAIGLYIDGVPYFQKSATDFSLNEIDYINILRGPQGTLYGRNTMGGVIDVYTKSPLQYQGLYAFVSAGNYANLNATMGYYAKVNNKFGYAVSGNYNHTDGYFTNLYTGKSADLLNAGSGRVRLDWAVNSNLILKLTQFIDYTNQNGFPYAPIDPETGKIGEVDYNDPGDYTRSMSTTGFSLAYTTKRFSLNSQTSYQYLSDKMDIDNDFTPQPKYFVTQRIKQSTFSEEANIKSTSQGWYQWLFGAFAFNQQINQNSLTNLYTGFLNNKSQDLPTQGISFYHQSIFKDLLIKGLSLTLGLRYDFEKVSNTYTVFQDSASLHTPMPGGFFSKLSFSQFTPKVALQYTLPSSQMIYASATKGYKTGGFNTTLPSAEYQTYQPEYSWNYEIGAKGQFWQNRIRAELCFFYIDWENQQIPQVIPNLGQFTRNAGHSKSEGIEASLWGKLFKNFSLQANWGLTHAVFLRYAQSDTVNYSGNYIPLVPSQTLGLAANYLIPVGSRLIDNLSVNLQYIGTGKIYWAEDNRVIQPYYGLLNGKITASKGIVQVSLWAKNITNTQYAAYSFALSGVQYAQKGNPFTAGISVNLNIK